MEPDVPLVARTGFGNAAGAYARGRPDYPVEISGWLREIIGLRAGARVVEIGAGTGKFTKLLVETGSTVIAIEPVEAMRTALEAGLRTVQAVDATAQATTLEASSCDAVVCAQSFHWFATPAALAEFHRILRPRGKLGLVWNVRDESVDWVALLTGILEPYAGDAPRYRTGAWRDIFADGPFLAPQETLFAYQHVGTPDRVILDRSLSVSFIAALHARERAKVTAEIESLIATHPALKGRETVAFPYRTHAFSYSQRTTTAPDG